MHNTKQWSQVYRGKTVLMPLLGKYKPVQSKSDDYIFSEIPQTEDRLANLNRICSFRLPPLGSAADIEFLRNKFGWCMPTEEQVLRSLKYQLSFHYVTKSDFFDFRCSAKSSSSFLSYRQARNYFMSKTSLQLEREKLMKKLTEELKEYEKNVDVDNDKNKLSHGPVYEEYHYKKRKLSINVTRQERKKSHLQKIANNAKLTFKTHNTVIEAQLEKKEVLDIELAKQVKTKLAKSKSVARYQTISKISRLEMLRKRLSHYVKDEFGLEALQPVPHEDAVENFSPKFMSPSESNSPDDY